MRMSFEWDEKKNQHNIEKHGIQFEDAQKIFDGPVLTQIDNRNDYGEIREMSLGLFKSLVILMVVHTDREGITRLISARKATRKERQHYEKEVRQGPNS